MLLRLIEDVERAIDHECYFAALALALTFPDICGKAAYPELKSDRNVGTRYKKWCQEFVYGIHRVHSENDPLSGDMPYLNEEMLYSLRNAFLHQGTPNVQPSSSWDERCQVNHFKLVITDPDTPDGELAMVKYDSERQIQYREITVGVRDICYRLHVAAKDYYEENTEKFTFFDFDLEDERKKK